MSFQSAVEYHLKCAYSRETRLRGQLDWSNKPDVFKRYPTAESLTLPRDLKLPKVEAHRVLNGEIARSTQPLDLVSLSSMLLMSYGFTAEVDYGPDLFLYRSAPSAGALYPVELYVVARDIDGLEDGLYHYSVENFALNRLRSGTPPDDLGGSCIVLTSLFFRSAWKYKNRAYRYCLLDGGHVAENLTLAGKVTGIRSEFSAVFDDGKLSDYLGLDPQKERPIGLVRLTGQGEGSHRPGTGLSQDLPIADPVAPHELVFDDIIGVADMTSAPLEAEIGSGLNRQAHKETAPLSAAWDDFQGQSLMGIIHQRRSRRNFKPQTVMLNDLARAMDMIATPDIGQVLNLGLVTNEIQDLSDGFYDYAAPTGRLQLLKGGFLGPAIGDAALNQDWMGRANIILVLSAPFGRLEAEYGPRSFRLAYLAAGRIGQRAYLAAETLGWGCCGIGAFFDGEVQNILGLPDDEHPFYMLPIGPIKKRSHGGRPTRR